MQSTNLHRNQWSRVKGTSPGAGRRGRGLTGILAAQTIELTLFETSPASAKQSGVAIQLGCIGKWLAKAKSYALPRAMQTLNS